jgi:hypothetical protein
VTVYSTRFVVASVNSSATAAAASFTVPAGRVAVVRSVDLFVDVVGLVQFRYQQSPWTAWVSTVGVPLHNVRSWEGRHVFVAGEVIGCYWGSGAAGVIASGYLLNA